MNPNNHSKDKEQRFPTPLRGIIVTVALVALVMFICSVLSLTGHPVSPQNSATPIATLPQIVKAITTGEVKTLTVRGDWLIATKMDGSTLSARKESTLSALETLQLLGAPAEALTHLPLLVEEEEVKAASKPTDLILDLTIFIIFISIILLPFLLFRRSQQAQVRDGSGYFGNLGRSNPRVISGTAAEDSKVQGSPPQVTFRDVAGADQAKLELQEIIEFLKEPAKFTRLGAHIPKGVLMAGPPGTGKTLLAKAVAGEAAVPFFSISGSEFVEMFVGVGAARVRDLFKRAKEQPPAVIFIDEIDAVGRQRGSRLNSGGNEEREQTLNQILVEMDGFTTDTQVIVMASTNRPDILDPALLRPGRFDRKVFLDRPDVQERIAILDLHIQGKPLASDISIGDLAKLTPGFVGADLENLVNEAAILAARHNLAVIGRAEFQDALERIIAGPEHAKILSEAERRVVAYHEAGHAVVMHHLAHGDPIHKVSIISRGMALGYTLPLPEGDRYLRSREAFEEEIVGLLGGRAAEEIIFEQVTTGAANDLERATKLARAMVTRYGFSPNLGLRTFGEEQGNPYLGSLGDIRDYSEEMAQAIDHEIRHILDRAYQRAKDIVVAQRCKLEALAESLIEYETIERPQFEALMS
jgi:cell division protease FtsH